MSAMNFDRMTTKLREAVDDARTLALGRQHNELQPEHLLLALLEQDDGVVPALVQKTGGDPRVVANALDDALGSYPRVTGLEEVYVARALKDLLETAQRDAQKM